MPSAQPDPRSEHRKALDDQLSSEPHLAPLDIPPGKEPRPLEEHIRHRRPVAIAGVVENGVVRLLDPQRKLPDHSRVIVVASEPA